MKTPAFMVGTNAVPGVELKLSVIDPSRIKSVAWTPGGHESSAPRPAQAPELSLVPPPPPPTPPPSAAGFVPLESAAPVVPGFSVEAERQLKAAIEALNSQGQRLAEQARSDALELGILIARRIVERELSANLEGVFSLIKSAIRRVGEDHVTRVRLNAVDVIRFEAAARADFSLGKIELVPDVTLDPGDVMVDTDSHTIDGRLATRFEELVRQLDGQPSDQRSGERMR